MQIEKPQHKIEELNQNPTEQSLSHTHLSEQTAPLLKNPNQDCSKCIVCGKLEPKYKCPRCLKPYCKLQHYRDHNLFCTEGFYKQQVENHLKQTKSTPEQRKQMKEILKKEEEIPDQIPDDPFVLRYEQILEKLQHGEQVKLTHLQEVQFAKFIEEWTLEEGEKQFWEIQDGIGYFFVENYEPTQQCEYPDLVKYRKDLSQKVKLIPDIKSLCVSPSSKLVYHIASIVYAGCLTFRLFNGEVNPENIQVGPNLKALCPLLGQTNLNPENVQSSLLIVDEQIAHVDKSYRCWIQLALQDLAKILSNKYLILQMFDRLSQVIGSKKVAKKLDFMKAYAKVYGQKLNQISKQVSQEIKNRIQRTDQADMVSKIKKLRNL